MPTQKKPYLRKRNTPFTAMKHPLELFGYCPKCGSRAFDTNDFKSKRCADCGFVYYFNAAAATVAVIANERGEILVARRAKEPARGTFDLPGGFSDSLETAEEGVAREVMEETGLRLTKARYLFSLPNRYLYSGFEVHTLDLFFLCETEEGPLCPRDDVEALQWMSIDELNPDLFGLSSIKKAIEKLKTIYKERTIK